MKSKKLVDIVTVVLLACAFGLAYYTGLVGKNETGGMMLKTNTFALISIVGSLVLMFVGGVSELIARVKNNAVTWSFTVLMSVQVFAFFGMCAISVALLTGAFSHDSGWIRALFIVFAAIELLGYVQAVLYTGGVEDRQTAAAVAAAAPAEEYEDEQPEEYEYYFTDGEEEFDEFGDVDDEFSELED